MTSNLYSVITLPSPQFAENGGLDGSVPVEENQHTQSVLVHSSHWVGSFQSQPSILAEWLAGDGGNASEWFWWAAREAGAWGLTSWKALSTIKVTR